MALLYWPCSMLHRQQLPFGSIAMLITLNSNDYLASLLSSAIIHNHTLPYSLMGHTFRSIFS